MRLLEAITQSRVPGSWFSSTTQSAGPLAEVPRRRAEGGQAQAASRGAQEPAPGQDPITVFPPVGAAVWLLGRRLGGGDGRRLSGPMLPPGRTGVARGGVGLVGANVCSIA